MSAAILLLPAIQLFTEIIGGDSASEALGRFFSLAGWLVFGLVVPFTVWGILHQRKTDLLKGITADYLGSLSRKELVEFRKTQLPLDEKRNS